MIASFNEGGYRRSAIQKTSVFWMGNPGRYKPRKSATGHSDFHWGFLDRAKSARRPSITHPDVLSAAVQADWARAHQSRPLTGLFYVAFHMHTQPVGTARPGGRPAPATL